MPSCPLPDRWTARAQVWLGTLVEVALPPTEACDARFAAAFAAIAHVHRTMSAHDAASDLARIARDAHRETVIVDPGTYAVLQLAKELWRASGGTFDVGIACILAPRGLLPASAGEAGTHRGQMDALRFESGYGVRATMPVAFDLGGIAKGYAVDRAVDALRATRASAGLVNAGGDLRIFGADHWAPIRVRHPADPTRCIPLADVCDAAVATSADYFRDSGGGLVDPRTRRMRAIPGSITVVAPTCADADALTKIVALRPTKSAAMLASHDACAFVLGDDGPEEGTSNSPSCATTCATSNAHVRLPAAAAT